MYQSLAHSGLFNFSLTDFYSTYLQLQETSEGIKINKTNVHFYYELFTFDCNAAKLQSNYVLCRYSATQ